MYKVYVYVPQDYLSAVKEAIFAVGAGTIGNYSHCCWQTLGEGQFKPLVDSNPHIGVKGKVTTVSEYKLEFVCRDEDLKKTLQALISAHPYETPAYGAHPIEMSD